MLGRGRRAASSVMMFSLITTDETDIKTTMGWLRLAGFLKWEVSFAEYSLFCRALLQKRPIILLTTDDTDIIMSVREREKDWVWLLGPFSYPPNRAMRWLRLVDSFKLQVSFAKEPYKRDSIWLLGPFSSNSSLTFRSFFVSTKSRWRDLVDKS